MKRVLSLLILLTFLASPLYSYKILYAEQFYKLFHTHFYQYPEDLNENIWYLEQALKSDFVNPQNALARIENPDEWEKYRYLFYMHVNLKLLEQFRLLGSKYDKRVAYFYNYPWKHQNLDSLRYAESYYQAALYYWEQALYWSEKASGLPYYLEEIQNWHDEHYRIRTGDLDYKKFISMDLDRLRKVRADFEAMDESTY
ncbi:MAG: hypothetical protein KAU17_08525 [Spirochaetales bacterium]|nr:hypothetical protein [Spirochaetales bacterium]